MRLQQKTIQTLSSFGIQPERGFLPINDPLTFLPKAFQAWENLNTNLSHYLNAGIARAKILELPLIENPTFQSESEIERAMALLTTLAHAYVNSGHEKADHIPPAVSIPLVKVATQLGRVPLHTHTSLVVYNWKRIDPSKPIAMNNLATLFQFHGGLDESWFYLITVVIEHIGAPAIPLLVDALYYLKNDAFDNAEKQLTKATFILQELTPTLERMYEKCDPLVFYKRVRPFLDSFKDIDYQGTELGRKSYHGGSAAQSSLLQFFDAVLGLKYEDIPSTKDYLLEMRNYMPPRNVAFLQHIESNPTLKDFQNKNESINSIYKKLVDQIIRFRNAHLKIVSIYIIKQAKAAQIEAKGTGGTNPMLFLKSIRNKNSEDLST